jgi:hypothetical protein
MDGDVTVRLRGGTYYREEPLAFGPADGGRNGYEVRYTDYGDETPVLVGGRPVTDWERQDGDVYAAPVDDESRFHTLYENADRARPARHPSEGYDRVAAPDPESPRSAFRYEEGDVPAVENVEGLQAYVWPGGPDGHWNWFSDVLDVTDVDEETRTIRVPSGDRYELGPGSRYYLLGHRAFLSEPGEFSLDRAEGTLYYRPLETPIDEREIVAPTVERVVEVRGDSPTRPVRNLRFEGLEIRVTDRTREVPAGVRGAVHVADAEDVAIERCRIRQTGLDGITLEGRVRRVTVEGNHVHDTGQTGIRLAGPTSREYANRQHRIANNHVHHVGRIVGHGHGIELSHSGNNEVANNRIHHSPRFGITAASMPRPTTMSGLGHATDAPHVVDGVEVNPHDAKLFQHTRNNLIEENDVSRCSLDSQDNGLIYTNTGGRGNVVRANRLHHSRIRFSFGFGLYLDDTSDGVVATENVIHDLNRGGESESENEGTLQYAIYAKGLDDVLENNVIADNAAAVAPVGSHEHGGTYNRGLVIERNVFADSGPNVYGFANWSRDRVARSDHNVWYHPEGEYGVEGFPEGYAYRGESYSVEDFADWRALPEGYDAHSELADPGFMAPGDDDYRLRYDSPAREHGVRDVDHGAIGLRPDYPFAREDPLARLFPRADVPEGTPAYLDLEPGEEARIWVRGRTETGFAVDSHAEEMAVEFESEAPAVAAVDGDGTVAAGEPGVARISATATYGGGTAATHLHVLVGDAGR